MKGFFKLWFFLVIVAAVGLVKSSPARETNAQRLARGLPPNPPKFLLKLLAKSTDSGTSNLIARKAPPYSPPETTLAGKLQLRNPQDGSVLGNVRNWPGGGTISGVNALGPDGDLLVSLKYNKKKPNKINILATNPAFPAPFYVGAGAILPSNVPELAAGSRNTVSFTNVELTPGGAGPTKPSTWDALVESAIWSLDSKTHKLTAQWVNADGSTPPTVLAYDIRENELFFVGDLAAYNFENDLPASAVDLFLVPA